MTINKRLGITLLGILLLTVLGYSVYTASSRSGKTILKLSILPPGAVVRLDGTVIKYSGGALYVNPGKHTIEVSRVGFESATKIYDIGTKQVSDDILLTPISDEAKTIAKKYERQYMQAEGRAGQRTANEGEAARQAYPLINSLPYHGVLFNIDYSSDQSGAISIQVSASTARDRALAIEKIRSLGYEPSNYTITFTNLPTGIIPE